MINILKFNVSNDYKFSWNLTSRSLFNLFENLDNCMVIYRYKLSDGFDVPFIWEKFGTSDPNKIDFNKLKGESILLFHLEVYQRDPEKIKDLLDWCLEKEVDIYIPISDNSDLNNDIQPILFDYEYNYYDFTSIKHSSLNINQLETSISESLKPLIRDLKIKKIIK